MPQKLSDIFAHEYIFTLIITISLIFFFTFLTPNYAFVNIDNIKNLFSMGPELGIIVLGVGLLMIAGEFDLSVGSLLQFTMFVFIVLFETGLNLFLVFIITLGVGAVLGLINAVITLKGKIPSFITTLGTMLLWRGATLFLSLGYARPFDKNASILFTQMLSYEIGGVVPVQIVWFLGFALLLGLILHHHKFGNWIYATGDNENAARAMGINTDKVKTICFIIVGTLCAFAAVMQTVRTGTFFSRAGDGWELKAIAACVIGGLSLRGGIGSMIGIVLGAITIICIDDAITLLRVDYFWSYVVTGVIIILYVVINNFVLRRAKLL